MGRRRPGDCRGSSISRPLVLRARRSDCAGRRSGSPGRGARPATRPPPAERLFAPRPSPPRRRPSHRDHRCRGRRQPVRLCARFSRALCGRPLRVPLSTPRGVPESVPPRRRRDVRRPVSSRARRRRCRTTIASTTTQDQPRRRHGARPSSGAGGGSRRCARRCRHCPLF